MDGSATSQELLYSKCCINRLRRCGYRTGAFRLQLRPIRGRTHVVEEKTYSLTIVGNVERCRTEVEISDRQGVAVAVVHEASDGWHTDILDEARPHHGTSDFTNIVGFAKEDLSHFVNRRGENAPQDVSVGALALWLMLKDDGSATGSGEIGPKSDKR
jgi:hypothetical protein